MSSTRLLHPTLGALACALVLAPAASADVSINTEPEAAGVAGSPTTVDITWTTVARLTAVRSGSSVVITAPSNGPDPAFTAGSGCVEENARRVVCAGSPRSVRFQPLGNNVDTDDSITIGEGIQPPPGTVQSGTGDDTVDVSGSQQISGAEGRRWTIAGGDGNDLLIGGFDFDTLQGGNGDDTLEPRERLRNAADQLSGGAGSDTLDVSENHADARAGISFALSGDPEIASIENYTGTGGQDIVTGSDDANLISTGAGDDRVEARGGNDQVFGGGGADNLKGEDGDDVLGGFTDAGPAGSAGGGLPRPGIPRDPKPPGFDISDLNIAQRDDGRDTIDGGNGADLIKTQGDGKVDSVDCGANGVRISTIRLPGGATAPIVIGTFDRAILDLVDREDGDCELVDRSDKDERGTVQLAPRKVSGSTLSVRMACPSSALNACTGRIGIVSGRRSERLSGGTSYRLRRGKSRTVKLQPARNARVPLRVRAVEAGKRQARSVDLLLSANR